MSNVLNDETKQQVIALGKLAWSLRRIERFTGVRRETAGAYLKAAGIVVQPPGAWRSQAPAKPAIEVPPRLFGGKTGHGDPRPSGPFFRKPGIRASALPFGDPRSQALFTVLGLFGLQLRGFTNQEIRGLLGPLLGFDPITPAAK